MARVLRLSFENDMKNNKVALKMVKEVEEVLKRGQKLNVKKMLKKL